MLAAPPLMSAFVQRVENGTEIRRRRGLNSVLVRAHDLVAGLIDYIGY